MSQEAQTQAASAYLLSEVGGQSEAERLRRQAEMILEQELPLILSALPPQGTLIDVGCGSGLLADAVAQRRPDAQVLGVDADSLAVQEAQRLFGAVRNLRFEHRPVSGGPPVAGGADVLVMRLVLMHLPGPAQALQDLKAWAKPGGSLHLLEGDDRDIRLEPAMPELGALLDLMERVQQARGGSRRRGRDLTALLGAAGWSPQGSRRNCPDPQRTAAALPAVFLPVADFYLQDAEKRAWLEAGEAAAWGLRLREACSAGLSKAELPLFHAWATHG